MKSEKLQAHLVEAANVIKFNLLALNSHSKNEALRVKTRNRPTLQGDINMSQIITVCFFDAYPSYICYSSLC